MMPVEDSLAKNILKAESSFALPNAKDGHVASVDWLEVVEHRTNVRAPLW